MNLADAMFSEAKPRSLVHDIIFEGFEELGLREYGVGELINHEDKLISNIKKFVIEFQIS